MNPMMISMLEAYLGKDKVSSMLQQWNSMTPQQQQAEITKVSQMSRDEQMQYLNQRGIDVNSIMNMTKGQQNTTNTNGGRFNY